LIWHHRTGKREVFLEAEVCSGGVLCLTYTRGFQASPSGDHGWHYSRHAALSPPYVGVNSLGFGVGRYYSFGITDRASAPLWTAAALTVMLPAVRLYRSLRPKYSLGLCPR
jgi:hypothetical protein